jgi:adenylate cyclase
VVWHTRRVNEERAGDGRVSGARLEEDLRRGLSRGGILANLGGASLMFAFLIFLLPVSPNRDDAASLAVRNGIVFALFMPATLALGTVWGRRLNEPVFRWLRESRPPDERERELVLTGPERAARISMTFWFLAAVVFGALNIDASGGLPFVVAGSLFLGGLTTGALTYLLVERLQRPVTALALEGTVPARPTAFGVRGRLTMAWALGTGLPLLALVGVGAVAVFQDHPNGPALARAALMLGFLGLGVGLLLTLAAARSVADPLTAVRSALGRVEQGDFDVEVPVDDGSEIGFLEAGFNRMADGLRERERIQDLFGRHVGEEVAASALQAGVELGGEVREVGVLFVDLVGSTSLAARRPPMEVVALLNRFFAEVVRAAEDHGGWVNKFEGDAALCVFGAPSPRQDPAGDALAAGRALRGRLAEALPEMDAGIGVSAGAAVAGNIGAEQRFEYTVIGDPVNEAARLCELSKQQAGRLLASEAAVDRARAEEAGRWTLGEAKVLRGRDSPTRLATVAEVAARDPA